MKDKLIGIGMMLPFFALLFIGGTRHQERIAQGFINLVIIAAIMVTGLLFVKGLGKVLGGRRNG